MTEIKPEEQILESVLITADYEEASKSIRFLNFVIDSFFYYAFAFVLGILFALIGMSEAILSMNASFFSIILYLVYFILCEGVFGTTPAKFFTRTKVVTTDGEKPGFGQMIGRSITRLIPFDGLVYLFTDDPWHDAMTGTRVVKKN